MWVGGGHGSYCKLQDMENIQYIKICKKEYKTKHWMNHIIVFYNL